MIPDKEDIMVVAVGRKPKQTDLFPNVHFLGSIHDERLMALAYAAADAFVIPSREDNLPNVMLEALASGTPVIGFPIGGLKETIYSGMNGLLAEEVSPLSLSNAIVQFFNKVYNSVEIRKFAEEQFHPQIQAQKYIELYQKGLT
jgi:glycosyltransferase involved in cell wall biosynthesis